MEQPGNGTFQKMKSTCKMGEYTLRGALYNLYSPDKLSMANQGTGNNLCL